MLECGIDINDTTNGYNIVYRSMIQCFCQLFPEGPATKITPSLLTQLAGQLNGLGRKHYCLGFKLRCNDLLQDHIPPQTD